MKDDDSQTSNVRDIQAGDNPLEKSWSIGRLRPWLTLQARRHMGDPKAGQRAEADPSDVVQQTLLRAWQAEHQCRSDSPAERLAWLRRILVNTVRENHRRGLAIKRGGDALVESLPVDIAVIEPVATFDSDEALRLAEAIESLPADQRHVITRRNFDGADYAVIAGELERSEPATRMMWVRALRGLRRRLGEIDS